MIFDEYYNGRQEVKAYELEISEAGRFLSEEDRILLMAKYIRATLRANDRLKLCEEELGKHPIEDLIKAAVAQAKPAEGGAPRKDESRKAEVAKDSGMGTGGNFKSKGTVGSSFKSKEAGSAKS